MKNEPFLLAKIKKAFTWKEGRLTWIELFINKPFLTAGRLDAKGMSLNPWLKLITSGKNPGKKFINSQLKKFNESDKNNKLRIATKDFPLRWSGGGGMLILNLPDGRKIIPIIKRAKIGQHPDKLDLPGGMSEKLSDMISPETLARREISEEIIIRIGKKTYEYKNMKNITGGFATHRVLIHHQKHLYAYTGIVSIDDKNAAIDTRNIFSISLKDNNFKITDGEISFDRNRHPLFQHRKIYLTEFPDLFKIPYGNITPAFKAVLEAIKKNDKYF